MGLSYDEFDDTTPVEFEELQTHFFLKQDLENSRFGQVCATLVNLKIDQNQKPYTPQDFFRTLSEIEQNPDTELEDAKNTAAVLDAFAVHCRTRARMMQAKKER